MDMPAPPCPVDYHLEGAELMTCKLSDLEYGSSVVLQVPLACLMGVALEQCTGVTETCLRLRLRLRFGTSGVTERCLRLREGLRVLPLSLQTKEHSNIFVAGWIKSLGKTVLLLELACSYKLTGATRYRLTAAEADALAGISSLRPYPHVSSAVSADTLSYPC